MRGVDHFRVMMTRNDLSNTFDPQLMRRDQGIRVDIMVGQTKLNEAIIHLETILSFKTPKQLLHLYRI